MYEDDPKSVREGNRAVQKKMLERTQAKLKDYRRVFSSEAGQRVLHDLIAANYILHPTVSKSVDNAYLMAIREGQRIAVLNILAVLETSPEKIKSLIEETHNAT